MPAVAFGAVGVAVEEGRSESCCKCCSSYDGEAFLQMIS